jgi:alkylation response protein AidB-like acyl-CoA dehydrogenase
MGQNPMRTVSPDEEKLVAAVRELARTRFAARAAAHDRERSFPAQNFAELKELRVHALWLPTEVGGLGMGAWAGARIMEEIAWADASTAVALNMHLLISHFASFIPEYPHGRRVIEDIAKNGSLICGPGSIPTGDLDDRKAGFRVVEEGDRLVFRGRAGFASASEGASYAIIGGLIERYGEPWVVLALPRLDSPGIKNLRNWDAMGMRATASHDIECDGLVIPTSEAWIAPVKLLREGQRQQTVPMLAQRSCGALGILGIWLGLAQCAHEFTLEYVGKRHGYLAGQTAAGEQIGYRADEAWAQIAIGRMEHALEIGRVVLYDTIAKLDGPFPDAQTFTRHMVRTVYHLRRMAETVAEESMKVCGAHAYVAGSRLERTFRDLVGANVMAWKTDHLAHLLGLSALGRDITLVGPAGT